MEALQGLTFVAKNEHISTLGNDNNLIMFYETLLKIPFKLFTKKTLIRRMQFLQAYGSHPMLRTTPYPSVGHLPPAGPGGAVQPPNVSASSMGYGGGYTLPPTAAYFPVGTYSTLQAPSGPQQTTIIEMQQQQQQQQHDSSTSAMTQPNTPDLLMHRRQVRNKVRTLCTNLYFLHNFFVFAQVFDSSRLS